MIRKNAINLRSFCLAIAGLAFWISSVSRGENSDRSSYAIHQLSHRNFEISNAERAVRLELISGDGSLIKINRSFFSLDLKKSRRHNELKLTHFLEKNFFPIKRPVSTLERLFIPKAHAEEWVTNIEGPRGLAQVIVGLVLLNKNSLDRREEGPPSNLRTKRPSIPAI